MVVNQLHYLSILVVLLLRLLMKDKKIQTDSQVIEYQVHLHLLH